MYQILYNNQIKNVKLLEMSEPFVGHAPETTLMLCVYVIPTKRGKH